VIINGRLLFHRSLKPEGMKISHSRIVTQNANNIRFIEDLLHAVYKGGHDAERELEPPAAPLPSPPTSEAITRSQQRDIPFYFTAKMLAETDFRSCMLQ
jgi:hypothetical protein